MAASGRHVVGSLASTSTSALRGQRLDSLLDRHPPLFSHVQTWHAHYGRQQRTGPPLRWCLAAGWWSADAAGESGILLIRTTASISTRKHAVEFAPGRFQQRPVETRASRKYRHAVALSKLRASFAQGVMHMQQQDTCSPYRRNCKKVRPAFDGCSPLTIFSICPLPGFDFQYQLIASTALKKKRCRKTLQNRRRKPLRTA